jgi:hypothetical protein
VIEIEEAAGRARAQHHKLEKSSRCVLTKRRAKKTSWESSRARDTLFAGATLLLAMNVERAHKRDVLPCIKSNAYLVTQALCRKAALQILRAKNTRLCKTK